MALARFSWIADRQPRAADAPRDHSREGGFSLVEVLVATGLLAVALTTLAQLFAVSTKANSSARATSIASVLAQQKMEQLRGLTFGFDNLGLPISDTSTDVTTVPETLAGGHGLSPSPVGSLGTNTDGYCDFVDERGNVLAGGTVPPPTTAYIRRWSVEPLPTNPNNTLVLQVLVTRLRNRGTADTTNDVKRLPDEARMVSLKTRKAT
jgi:type II secretory pathway pseudopilin PulG